MKKFLLVDGNSLINRAYYATALANGGSYGFLNMFFKALQDTQATHVVVAFDVRAKTFRHKLFDDYKAGRKSMPDDLAAQLCDLKVMLGLMNITMFEKEGFEADDIIGTLAQKFKEHEVIILTADRDLLQIIDENVKVELTKTGVTNIEIYDVARIQKEYGVTPKQLIDIKALMGDKSDNIPGAPGVGEKTAFTLIKEFGSVESLLETTDIAKVKDNAEIIRTSKTLATINCSVPLDNVKLSSLAFSLPLARDMAEEFKQRNFLSFLRREGLWGKQAMQKPVQQSFFMPGQDQEPIDIVLSKMSRSGCKIDIKALQNLVAKLKNEIENVAKQVYEVCGQEFNLNSPKQLGDMMYRKLGIETTQKTKDGVSTSEAILQKIKNSHPIVPLVLRHRKLQKMRSYIDGLESHADGHGFIHSTFQCNTNTGRLSSSNPNIQNIPTRSEEATAVRVLFVSRFDDGKILCADYSQIELRILAHLSGDPTMVDAFNNGRDIHDETAKALGLNRRTAKAVNFGITYGQSAFGLSQILGIHVGEATRFIESYFAKFAAVKTYLDSVRDQAITHGFSTDLFGNKRILPDLNSKNHHLVGHGLRAAINMPMQGSAAEVMKRAMLEIDKQITSRNLKSVLINQIHDELVFDCPPDETEQMATLVKTTMESIIKLNVPLDVNVEIKATL